MSRCTLYVNGININTPISNKQSFAITCILNNTSSFIKNDFITFVTQLTRLILIKLCFKFSTKYTFSIRVEETLLTLPILRIFPFELSPKESSPPFLILVKLETMYSFRSYALNNHCPSTICSSSSSSPVEKISSLRYLNLFGSLSVSNGSFWNPNTFYFKICISYVTIFITIVACYLIVNGCTLHKVVLIKLNTHFCELSKLSNIFCTFVNFKTISLSSIFFFLSISFSFFKSSTCGSRCSWFLVSHLIIQLYYVKFYFLILSMQS